MNLLPVLNVPLGTGTVTAVPVVAVYKWHSSTSSATIPAPTDGAWTTTTKYNDSGATDPDGHTTFETVGVGGIGTTSYLRELYDAGQSVSRSGADFRTYYGAGAQIATYGFNGVSYDLVDSESGRIHLGDQWENHTLAWSATSYRYWVIEVTEGGDGSNAELRIGNGVLS